MTPKEYARIRRRRRILNAVSIIMMPATSRLAVGITVLSLVVFGAKCFEAAARVVP